MTTMLTTLERSRDLVAPALRAALQRLDATSRAQAMYHFGWSTADGQPAAGGGGKAVRPALALLSAEAGGAPRGVGLPGAVAVELVHNFSLLHDDVMDRDVMRRHRPTVWAVWGVASAILTGDALLALAQEVLLECESRHAKRAAALLATATRLLVGGQAQDLAFEQRCDVTLEECLDMAAGKTGSLLSASAAVGAVLAGAPEPTVDALSAFGAHLGIAFQLVDDLLGIWGDPDVTGKPIYSDLRSRKKSLPVTYAMTQGAGGAGQELAGWLTGTDPVDEADLPGAARLVAAAGGRDWALEEAKRRLGLAESALDGRIPEAAHAELTALGQSIVERQA